jgi:predicted outer membrane repeat protein
MKYRHRIQKQNWLTLASTIWLAQAMMGGMGGAYAGEQRGGFFATVGSDASCEFNSIQDAAASGRSELRLANNQIHGSVVLPPGIERVVGGYNSCGDAQIDLRGPLRSTIDGANSAPALTADLTGQLELVGLEIRNGYSSTVGGGVSMPQADLTLTIRDSEIHSNEADIGGGGIGKDVNGSSFIVVIGSRIHNNRTSGLGGGVYLANSGEFVMLRDSSLDDNSADNGGGAAIVSASMNVTGGDNLLIPNGISSNRALTHGGAIYADNGIVVLSGSTRAPFGNNSTALNLFLNKADSDADNLGSGGLIHAINSSIEVLQVAASLNTAHRGGVFSLDTSSELFVLNPNPGNCWNDTGCSVFASNSAAEGGVVAAGVNNFIQFDGVLMTGNRGTLGSVAALRSEFIDMTLVNSYVVQNGDPADSATFALIDDAELSISYSTVVDNVTAASIIASSNSPDIAISNSLLYNPLAGGGSVSSPANTFFECVYVDDANNAAGNGVSLMTAADYSGMFRDPGMFDYRLNPDDPDQFGRDFCAASTVFGSATDFEGDPRGNDDPQIINRAGPYDLGADEVIDELFKDRFEG